MKNKLHTRVSNGARALLSSILGLTLMIVVVRVFFVSSFDFNLMRRDTLMLLSGKSPWAPENRMGGFYNPPFSFLFLWILVFTNSKIMIVIGGTLLVVLMFYHRAWVAAAWFGTHTFLWLIAAGNIDMYVIGSGLVLLLLADKISDLRLRTILRILAYGFLLIKPQGGLFIVVLYILLRRDWLGGIVSVVVYGLFFAPLYPGWINYLLTDPPVTQVEAAHSVATRFGILASIPLAILVAFSRRWTYWQLGGALAGILSPYGMPGVPIFLILMAVDKLAAIPAILVYSGCLAVLTWVAPQSPLMGIYHLGMLGIALVLACFLPAQVGDDADTIALADWLKATWRAKFAAPQS
ncbi:MAG: hypothetical protein JXA89_24575 [Anaerolineae bacterium]|nr:hypothetical protein [Anaerolineae bacterium]